MSLTGRSTLSLRKKDVLEQKQAGSAYKRIVFAHKAAANETGIDLTNLTAPSEMTSLGFTNPNTQELLAAKILFYKKNVTVVSSSKGVLIQDLSYTIPTNSRIAFQGFVSDENEIFTVIIDSAVKDGLQAIDSSRVIATGTLPATQVQFNVGTPFQVGKHITQQVGSVMVFVDGIQQFRNSNNSSVTKDANYFEVDAGGGLGNIIELNSADPLNDRSILVIGEVTAERPLGSTMAVVESLAGQVDAMIPTLAALAGVPETNFQAAPNNVDLKSFGDTVYSILELEILDPNTYSSVRLNTANGYGSTNTRIRRFLNINENIGPDISYSDSATLGSSFTINSDGVYYISYTEGHAGDSTVSISLNSTNLTTNATTIAANTNNELLSHQRSGSVIYSSISWVGFLPAGSIIRPHTDAQAPNDVDAVKFSIAKVGQKRKIKDVIGL